MGDGWGPCFAHLAPLSSMSRAPQHRETQRQRELGIRNRKPAVMG